MRAFHIRRFLSRPRLCVFCGQPPKGKTREHIIPMWLIEQTGDPNRKIVLWPLTSQSVILGRSAPFMSFSFASLAFPSCDSCNSESSKLESKVKPILSSLMAGGQLSSLDFDVLLDWFDKVRVGLWLGFHYYLNRNFWGVTPHYFISQRIAAADRCIVVRRAATYEQGIRFAGVNTPAFAFTPSCFSLVINEWLLLNISHHMMLSKAAGFPFATSYEFGPGEQLRMQVEPGEERLSYPLFSMGNQDGAVVIGQPIVSRGRTPNDVADLYSSEYIARFTFGGNRGRILLQKEGEVSLYPDEPTTAWRPITDGDFPAALKRNGKETLEVQAHLTRMISLSPSLSREERESMKIQIDNCISDINSMLKLMDGS